MKNYRKFARCTIFEITYVMHNTSIFTGIMTMISNLTMFFIFHIFIFKFFFANITNFAFSYGFFCFFINHFILFFLKLISWQLFYHKGSFISYIHKIFHKTNISYLLINNRTCRYQGGRNVTSNENFAYVQAQHNAVCIITVMCRTYYTTIERLRNYMNDARLLYPWNTHIIKFIIYLVTIAIFPLKEE